VIIALNLSLPERTGKKIETIEPISTFESIRRKKTTRKNPTAHKKTYRQLRSTEPLIKLVHMKRPHQPAMSSSYL
jgi:hypothetical protein